jgi:hypothetical protein
MYLRLQHGHWPKDKSMFFSEEGQQRIHGHQIALVGVVYARVMLTGRDFFNSYAVIWNVYCNRCHGMGFHVQDKLIVYFFDKAS